MHLKLIKNQKNSLHVKIFTLIELLVVISIIALLMSILLPALRHAKMKVETSSCANNCRQMGIAIMQYSGDFNEWIVPAKAPSVSYSSGSGGDRPWMELLGKFGPYSPLDYGLRICSQGNTYTKHQGNGPFIMCPSQKTNKKFIYSDYAVNVWLFGIVGSSPLSNYYFPHKITQITNPSIAKYVFDNGRTDDYQIAYVLKSSGDIDIDFRHIKQTNVLYADGHVNSVKYLDLTALSGGNGKAELLEGFKN
jgi:prepilin-type processing-associated H-X9-DG protein/prepilin-type N-terminal cleavage/methylation domain-containing protein